MGFPVEGVEAADSVVDRIWTFLWERKVQQKKPVRKLTWK